MKLFAYFLFLLFGTVVAAPVRARRGNVLSFLNDAVRTATDRTVTAAMTADRKPPSGPVKEQDSEDMSEAKSTESYDTNGFSDAFKNPDSDEITIPKVAEKDKAPSRRKTGLDKDNMGMMDMSGRSVQDQGSREHSGPHPASREPIDLNSEEGMTVDAQRLSGKQVIRSSGVQAIDRESQCTNLQRKAAPAGVDGIHGMLAPGRSGELVDLDSLEDNNGRPAPVGNRGDVDYDETREFISSEIYPIAPPQHAPSSLSVPSKSQAA